MDATAPPAPDEDDLDAPGLPDRLVRKAETAVLGRTSRILCVVERCTDEHNYSAVLRTAEALGVQHVWLVDPVVREADGGLGAGGGCRSRCLAWLATHWVRARLRAPLNPPSSAPARRASCSP